jgi:hypothetical protein
VIAFARSVVMNGDLHAALDVVDAADGTRRTILGPTELFEVYDLEWSPDGSHLAVLHHPVDPPTAGLLTIAPNGSHVRWIALCEKGYASGLCSTNGGSVAWSLDGQSVAFDNYDGHTHAVSIVDSEGAAQPVSGGLEPGCCLAWRPQ